MEENLKEVSINELKEKRNKLTEQLDAVYTELDERKRRDAIIAELFYNFSYMGSLNDIINIVDELNDLEINMKDARLVVEGLVGYGNEYFDKEIVFTNRAKKVLERAWLLAKKSNKQKIEAVDLLIAITEEPDSLAMKVLDQLGVDAVEIKHGIQAKIRRMG